MPTFWKDLLHPGRYRLPDGRVVPYTAADSRAAAATGTRMLAAGLRVPVCWEHDPAADPVRRNAHPAHATAWLARGYAGEARAYRAGADGVLHGLIDIPDPADAEQFRRVGTVSPRVNYDFTDEDGVTWPGVSIGHVAVTAKPVQRRQARAEFGWAAAARRVSGTVPPPGPGRARDHHDLGLATALTPPGDPPVPESSSTAAGTGGSGDAMTRVVAKLRTLGVDPGDAKDLEELDIRLDAIVASRAAGDPTEGDPDPDADPGLDGPPAGAGPGAGPPPVMMSWLAKRAAVDAGDLDRRIDDLFRTNRVDRVVAERLRGKLKAANLGQASYDLQTFDLKPLAVVGQIEAYEQLPPGPLARRPARRPADLSVVAPPAELVGDPDGDAEAVLEMRRVSQDRQATAKAK